MAEKPAVIKVEHIGKKYIIRHNRINPAPSEGKAANPATRLAKLLKRRTKEDFWALKDINFEIRQGERVGIIGKNGAGKSTLLKLLSRITEPTEGRIELTGKISAMLEVGTGFNPELTGRENVYLNGAILGMSKAEIDDKFDRIVAFSEIDKFIDTPVKRYSSGMYVRLAFAVASHLDPDILIIDEVLAVGDQKFRQKCMDRMNEIAQGNKTILCVSHQMNVIRELCDRVIVLQNGKLIYDGETEAGIRFYLNAEREPGQDFFDLKVLVRPDFIKPQAHLNALTILNSSERAQGLSGVLRFQLDWSADKDLDGVKLRLMVRYADGAAVGIALSAALCDAKAGESYRHCFAFDTGRLFPGDYTANLALYQSDAEGGSNYLDHAGDAIAFEVYELQNRDKSIIYSHQYWGHVRLDDLIVTNKQEED